MKTELERILSVSGKPGLYQLLTGGKNTIIAESLVDGKKQPIHASQRVSSLADISIFTYEEDVPLREVFEKMKDHYKSGPSIDTKADSKALRNAVKEFLPTYDADRVYDSDLRKLFGWYNILQAKGMLDFAEVAVEDEAEDQAEEA